MQKEQKPNFGIQDVVGSRRTRPFSAVAVHHWAMGEKKAFEGYGFYSLISALNGCFEEG